LEAKASARAALKAARAAFPPEQRASESAAAVRALLESDLLNGATVVALYAALAEEADPAGLEEPLRSRGVQIAYPRVTKAGLAFHLARAEELRPIGPFGIREPEASAPRSSAIDAYVVPGLGFTRDGHRIGYGRGYYDRVLGARGDALAIGFCWSVQLVDRLPTEGHDVALDAVVAGEKLIRVGRGRVPE
jgi:5-formyltetrahydrofolate cyclo-ligase